MIESSIDGRKWSSNALEKLKAFLERSPLMVTNIIGTDNGKDGVFIIIESDKKKIFFPFDYEIDPKLWIHNIKDTLIPYYPRLVENIMEPHILTPKEKADMATTTGTITDIPDFENRVISRNCWRIDKVLHYRDIFILYLEGIVKMDDSGNESFVKVTKPVMRRYKYCSSSVIYLKKLRNNEFKNVEEWSKEFFDGSIPLDDLKIKEN